MKLLVDENITEPTVILLKQLGFEIIRSKVVLHKGADDEDIFAYACKNQIPLLTHDRGFGKIYIDSAKTLITTIILREVSPHPKATNKLLRNRLSQLDLQAEDVKGKLILIAPASTRIRDKTHYI